jgi:hypothetical protein
MADMNKTADSVTDNSKAVSRLLPAKEDSVQRTERMPVFKGQLEDAKDTLRKVVNNEKGYAGLGAALDNKLTSEYVIQGAGAAGGAALGLLLSSLIHRNPNWLLRLLYAGGGGVAGWFGTEALMDPKSIRLNAWKNGLKPEERAEVEKALDTIKRAPDSSGFGIYSFLPQTKTQLAGNAAITAASSIAGKKIVQHANSTSPTYFRGPVRVHQVTLPKAKQEALLPNGKGTGQYRLAQLKARRGYGMKGGLLGTGAGLLLSGIANWLSNYNSGNIDVKDL